MDLSNIVPWGVFGVFIVSLLLIWIVSKMSKKTCPECGMKGRGDWSTGERKTVKEDKLYRWYSPTNEYAEFQCPYCRHKWWVLKLWDDVFLD